MSRSKIYKWDPCWGWNNDIYYLGASSKGDEPFWLKKSYLYSNEKIKFSSPKNSRLSAGSFTNDFYFGSFTYDLFKAKSEVFIDQSIFVCNKNWDITTEFRPSTIWKKPNKYFSKMKYLDQLIMAFRDPAPINQSNKLAVCTGGFRWGINGNVCEVTFDKSTFEITRETILDENMMIFDEIERCTFWNEFMFFSAREKANIHINKIQVAKLNRNGFYSYFGEVQNSENLYGPCVNKNLDLLYWYEGLHEITKYPNNEKLTLENNEWIIKGRKYTFQTYIHHIREKKIIRIIAFFKRNLIKFLKNIIIIISK